MCTTQRFCVLCGGGMMPRWKYADVGRQNYCCVRTLFTAEDNDERTSLYLSS